MLPGVADDKPSAKVNAISEECSSFAACAHSSNRGVLCRVGFPQEMKCLFAHCSVGP